MKYVIRTLAALATLLIVAFIALSLFVATIDPNDYKDKIEAAVSNELKLPVAIGAVEMQSFPALRITLRDVSVGNPQGFNGNLLEVDEITAGMSIMPLLRGQFEIGNIAAERIKVNLMTAQSGLSNWNTITDAAKTAGKDGVAAPAAVAVSRISLIDATVRWQDLQESKDWQASKLNLTIGALMPGLETDIEVDAEMLEHRTGIGADVAGQLTLTVNLEEKIIVARDFDISLIPYSRTAKPHQPIRMTGDAEINIGADKLTLSSLSARQGESVLKGAAVISAFSKRPVAQFNVTESQIASEPIETLNTMTDAALPDLFGTVSFIGNGTFNAASEKLDLNDFAFSSDGLSVKGKGSAENFSTDPVIRFDIADSNFAVQSLRPFLSEDALAMLPPGTRQIRFSGKGSLDTAAENAAFSGINLSSDDFSIVGTFRISDYSGAPSIYARGSIDAEKIDLDHYDDADDADDAERKSKSASPPRQTAGLSQTPALALYEKLDADVDVSVSELKVHGLAINKLRGKIVGKNKNMKISLSPLSIFGGKFNGEFSASLKNNELQWSTLGKAGRLSARQLLKLAELDKKVALQGRLNLDYALKASGTGGKATLESLSGNAKFSMTDSKFDNPELASSIEQIVAYFEKRKPMANSKVLNINSMTGSIRITQGQAVNRNLDIDTPLLHIKGQGAVDLVTQAVNYRLLVGTLKQEERKRTYIPIRITGTLGKPKYRVDIEEAIKETAKKKVSEKIQREIRGKIENVLDKILR